MDKLAYLSRLWHNLTHRRKVERELDQEMIAYLALLADETSPREARLEAGGIEQLKEQVREVKAGFFMQTILQDVRYGWRMLRRSLRTTHPSRSRSVWASARIHPRGSTEISSPSC